MPALNRVQLIGRLGKGPEGKYTPTGKKVIQFSVAVSERWKNREGETKEYTEWINVEAWGRLGEVEERALLAGRSHGLLGVQIVLGSFRIRERISH